MYFLSSSKSDGPQAGEFRCLKSLSMSVSFIFPKRKMQLKIASTKFEMEFEFKMENFKSEFLWEPF